MSQQASPQRQQGLSLLALRAFCWNSVVITLRVLTTLNFPLPTGGEILYIFCLPIVKSFSPPAQVAEGATPAKEVE
jgi:hypothetical protein